MDRSNAHHLLHPSPVPHHMAAIPVGSKSLLHNNQGTTTPASAAVDASFGTSTFGNLSKRLYNVGLLPTVLSFFKCSRLLDRY